MHRLVYLLDTMGAHWVAAVAAVLLIYLGIAIQYRPGLIEGCLAGTGLALDQVKHRTDIMN